MCKKAKERGMGIVIEFDGGLFANPDMFVPRLNETIDELEIQGVYEAQTALAYYEGGRLVRDIHYGKHKSYKPTREQLLSIKKIMDRIAQHIVDRHPKTYKSTGDYQQPPNNKSNNSTNSSYDWRNPDYWHF